MSKRTKKPAEGFIFTRPGTKFYWCGYYGNDGTEHRKSTKVEHHLHKPASARKRQDAKRAAWEFLGDKLQTEKNIVKGVEVEISRNAADVTVGELLTLLEARAKQRDLKTARTCIPVCIKNGKDFFGHFKAMEVNETHVSTFIDQQRPHWRPATINRVLALVNQSLILGRQRRLIPDSAFRVELLPENNTRSGFVEVLKFEEIVSHLPEPLQDFTNFAYYSSWRRGQIASLLWRHVHAESIECPGEYTKNGDAVTVPLTRTLATLISKRRDNRAVDCDHVFHRAGTDGKAMPIITVPSASYLRHHWWSAVRAAGIPDIKPEGKPARPGLLFHDLRRSGVRNLIRSGVSQTVAMSLSTHRSLSIFQRYNITDVRDQVKALNDLENYLNDQRQAAGPKTEKKPLVQ